MRPQEKARPCWKSHPTQANNVKLNTIPPEDVEPSEINSILLHFFPLFTPRSETESLGDVQAIPHNHNVELISSI